MIRYLVAFLLAGSTALAGMGIGVAPYPGPGAVTSGVVTSGVAYAGWPTTDSVPNSPIGSFAALGSSGDRLYCWAWSASEGGQADAINSYVYDSYASTDNALLAVYKNNTLIGYSGDIRSFTTRYVWTGYQALTAASGQSLNFAQNDTISVCWAGDNALASRLAYDTGDLTNTVKYYNGSWTATPSTTVASFSASTSKGMAIILRYNK